MEKIFGELEVHCSFHGSDDCEFATMENDECKDNDNMTCNNDAVFKKLLQAAQNKESLTDEIKDR